MRKIGTYLAVIAFLITCGVLTAHTLLYYHAENTDKLQRPKEQKVTVRAIHTNETSDLFQMHVNQLTEIKRNTEKEQQDKRQVQPKKKNRSADTAIVKDKKETAKTAHTDTAKGTKKDTARNTGKAGKASPGTSDAASVQPLVARTKLAGRTRQILTVAAHGSRAHIEFWQKQGSAWVRLISTEGHVGSRGVGATREGMSKTPYGAYSLGFTFGTENPGTALPFRKITANSWWVEDSKSPQYNTWQEGKHFNSPSEHLADYPVPYHYAIVINYNTARVPYAGSGFFVHCDNGLPTAGCVSLPTGRMRRLMQIVRPGAYIVNVNREQEIANF